MPPVTCLAFTVLTIAILFTKCKLVRSLEFIINWYEPSWKLCTSKWLSSLLQLLTLLSFRLIWKNFAYSLNVNLPTNISRDVTLPSCIISRDVVSNIPSFITGIDITSCVTVKTVYNIWRNLTTLPRIFYFNRAFESISFNLCNILML